MNINIIIQEGFFDKIKNLFKSKLSDKEKAELDKTVTNINKYFDNIEKSLNSMPGSSRKVKLDRVTATDFFR